MAIKEYPTLIGPLATTARALHAWTTRRTGPGPRGSVLLGSLPELWRHDFFRLLDDAWRQFGDLACFRMGTRLMFLVAHPDHVAHILIHKRDNYTKQNHRARPLIGYGLPAADGELWQRQRRLLQPHFTSESIRRFSIGMSEAAARMAERWESHAERGETVDIAAEMLFFALDTITRTITGNEIEEDTQGLRAAIDTAVDLMSQNRQVFRLPMSLPTAANRRFKAALGTIDAFVYRVIEARRASNVDRGDLLWALLHASDRAGGPSMSAQQVRDEVVTMFLAGHETTARALTWTWYLLDRHPEVQGRLLAEISSILNGRIASAADLPALQTLECVLEESMRLYPPLWVFPRRAAADDELGGSLIPAGSTMMLVPYFTHRHPSFWDAPDEFRPERFAPEQAAARPRGAYYPFGLGPRICIGNRFALLEAAIVLSALMPRFRLTLAPGHVVRSEFSTMLRPLGGLPMIIQRRAEG